MSFITIVDNQGDKRIEFEGSMLLSDALRLSGLHFSMPCSGKRTCAKCRIKVHGALSELDALEVANLTAEELEQGIRLACCTFALGDATIYYNTNDTKMQVVEGGLMPQFEKKPVAIAVKAELHTPTLACPIDDESNIEDSLGLKIPLGLLKTLPSRLRNTEFSPSFIKCNGTAIGIIAEDEKYYGVAIDIGTTTVAVYLYDLSNCKLISTASGHNAQAVFGADVISRIEHVSTDCGKTLQNAIVNQINALLEELANSIGIKIAQLYATVITGNTTMLHLLCGIEPKFMAVSPFAPASLFGNWINALEIGIKINENGLVYLPRCITAYIGADISTGLIASGIFGLKGYNLLIDIGTNGEMALGTPDGIVCCSTAAGPAFEGAGLYMGMAGIDGAVSKIWVENKEIKYEVIGKTVPKGICGSGIIDAVATMLNVGVLDETGIINEDGHDFEEFITEYDDQPAFKIGESGVLVTQKDIRQIQLAKSAIAAGIKTLINECKITCAQVDTLFIAGGFGSFIDQKSAAEIGLFPKELLDKVTVLGNAAGTGASMLLLSEDMLNKSVEIAKNARTIELSTNSYFMDKYIDCMMLGE